MAEKKKAIDGNGLLYVWQKIINHVNLEFVKKDGNKVLSSNDYTTEEKTKLAGIPADANKTTVVDNLSSTSASDALSANQGRVLNEKINAINTSIQGAGKGDMQVAVWDTNNNGQIDKADWAATAATADKLGGELPSAYVKQTEIKDVAKTGSYNDLTDKPDNFAPASHEHEQNEIIGLSDTIATVTEIANGKCKSNVFDTVSDMETWLSNSENTAGLKVGDVFLIRATDVPDYWWDGTSAQVLETTKVEIEFLTNEEIDAILATA